MAFDVQSICCSFDLPGVSTTTFESRLAELISTQTPGPHPTMYLVRTCLVASAQLMAASSAPDVPHHPTAMDPTPHIIQPYLLKPNQLETLSRYFV